LKDFDIDLSENDKIDLILDATKAKAKTLKELAQEIKKILESPKEYDKKALKKAFKGEAKELLTQFLELLKEKNPQTVEEFHNALTDFVADKGIGFGKIGQPLRVALIGNLSGPELDKAMYILGVAEVENRIRKVLEEIS
jgi:glutamyl-tRNA synthetase